MSTNSIELLDPVITKAKFIFPNERIYTLEFDHNIQMQELKTIIQKAAHLRRNSFRLFSNGEEYTQYNSEIFASLFPNQNLVIFDIHLVEDEDIYNQNELILQMSSPCSIHTDKFLLYFCLTCNTSICNDCFTSGAHKNHLIQDKCYYLLPSKYLVDKLFENWSKKPYEEFKISTDLSELKQKLNSVMFQELFNMLKKVQDKCNSLIDEYNKINENSLNNIRNSVRDIQITCIKALDGLKDDLNIQNIVNNQDIFIQFDQAYKELGNSQKEIFKKNLGKFEELNQKVSILVENLIRQIYSEIYKTLNNILNNSQFVEINNQINMKFIKPHEEKEIMSRISEHKKKRNSLKNINNINNNDLFKVGIAQNKINSVPSKGKNLVNQNIKTINPFMSQDMDIEKKNNNTAINHLSNNNVSFGFKNVIVPNNIPKTIGQVTFGVKKEPNKNNIQINISKGESENPFSSSAQLSRQNQTANIIPKINITNSNLLSSSSSANKEVKNSLNKNNQLNSFLDNNLNDISNDNNNITTSEISNTNIINQTQPPIYKAIETRNVVIKNENPNIIYKNNYNIENGSINNSSLNNNTIKYIESIGKMNNNLVSGAINSENESRTQTKEYKIFNGNYILYPISQTYDIKIITDNKFEESTVSVKFPENFGFNAFFLDCAHCNCDLNKCLYVSGGIESTPEKKRSNVLLCVEKNENNEFKVKKLANMNNGRCGHSMISEGKYLYVLGGEEMNSVERYDIENDIWENLPPMISKRMYPILYINNGYLYAFFGKYKNGEYPCTIERLNINQTKENIKPAWEMIVYSNPDNVDVRVYGTAAVEYYGLLYFMSGKVNEKTTNGIFYYNYDQRIIQREQSKTDFKECFRENKLYPIFNKFVQCSDRTHFGVYVNILEED